MTSSSRGMLYFFSWFRKYSLQKKLTLSSGMPDRVEQLHKTAKDTSQRHEEFTLHYLDEDFGYYFSLHSPDQVKHKRDNQCSCYSIHCSFTVAESETENTTYSGSSFDITSLTSSQLSSSLDIL
ncbi:hypothetical protein ATANTOWER_028014 [Ataeniobius toweri]|uniref:Uncharacterized protein n=1 Tax=Ataeniobius toweri TaxID=208326 RepID=A0ABU7BBW4_9TELE|nr:hypothetical protein [Ataeniobius toweri]